MEFQTQPGQGPGRGCFRFGLIGCGVVVLLLFIGIGWMLYVIQSNPVLRGLGTNLATCKQQMTDIAGAIDRYHASTQEYPKDLKALVPDYLASSKVFHCPADSDKSRLISYAYTRPQEEASGRTIILRCDHHRLPKGNGEIVFLLHKDGTLTTERKM